MVFLHTLVQVLYSGNLDGRKMFKVWRTDRFSQKVAFSQQIMEDQPNPPLYGYTVLYITDTHLCGTCPS